MKKCYQYIYIYIYIYILSSTDSLLLYTGVSNSWKVVRIYAYVIAGNSSSNYIKHWRERMYRHPLADCFVVSQLFSVTWHATFFKLGSKPADRYPLRKRRNFFSYIFIWTLSLTGGLNSWEKLHIYAYVAERQVRKCPFKINEGDHYIAKILRKYF